MRQNRIFITGGHWSPAAAVIAELKTRGDWEIFYLGRRFGMEDDQAEALEYQEIRKIPGVSYLVITTGRLQPKFFINLGQSVKAFLKIFLGFWQAPFLLLKFHPDVVLSFGGYVAVPVVFWAWLLGTPVATHEQTVISGRANNLLTWLADKILVSWPEVVEFFPADKTVLTGNPIRQEIFKSRPVSHKLPVIYVTGGNLGAHVINVAVAEILPKLLLHYEVIHQTGDSRKYQDFDRLKRIETKNYKVLKFLDSQRAAQMLVDADLVVTRAGANTITELLALGKMAIFIPIPWSNNNEQLKNAQMVESLGIAEILPQDKLKGTTLFNLVTAMFKNKEKYLANAPRVRKLIIPDGAKRIVQEMLKLTS